MYPLAGWLFFPLQSCSQPSSSWWFLVSTSPVQSPLSLLLREIWFSDASVAWASVWCWKPASACWATPPAPQPLVPPFSWPRVLGCCAATSPPLPSKAAVMRTGVRSLPAASPRFWNKTHPVHTISCQPRNQMPSPARVITGLSIGACILAVSILSLIWESDFLLLREKRKSIQQQICSQHEVRSCSHFLFPPLSFLSSKDFSEQIVPPFVRRLTWEKNC